MTRATFSPGWKNIVAAHTAISEVHGKNSTLSYRGINIDELVDQAGFEETCYLLLYNELPSRHELIDFTATLSAHRAIPASVIELLRSLPRNTEPIDALRTAVSFWSALDADVQDISTGAVRCKAVRLIAQLPVFVASYHAFRCGTPLIRPSMELAHAENILNMLGVQQPGPDVVRALQTYLILLAEHSLNASTFTARVVASTQADLYAAITAALSALKGPLHGGACEATLRMLTEIGEPANANGYVTGALAAKRKLPGFGHRIYKNGDPRVKHLKPASQYLGRRRGERHWYEISRAVEDAVEQRQAPGATPPLHPNVDFYSASLLHCMGIPIDLFTPLFACARIVGWCAHVIEQYEQGVLMRPDSEYIGPRDQHYVPLERRGAIRKGNSFGAADASEHLHSGIAEPDSPDDNGASPVVFGSSPESDIGEQFNAG